MAEPNTPSDKYVLVEYNKKNQRKVIDWLISRIGARYDENIKNIPRIGGLTVRPEGILIINDERDVGTSFSLGSVLVFTLERGRWKLNKLSPERAKEQFNPVSLLEAKY